MPRTPIPPGIRWKVFARDGFRCRYCGAMAGDVVLVVDHVHPVAHGGRNHFGNLISACEECNQGKSDDPAPKLLEIQDYVTATEHVIGWLSTAWDDATGDDVQWQPNHAMYMSMLLSGQSQEEISDMIRFYGEQATHFEEDPETLLQHMDNELNPPERA